MISAEIKVLIGIKNDDICALEQLFRKFLIRDKRTFQDEE
mgnify:CR=1 FL=1|jgi:hypothetical protein